ncbi:MAG: hypothetical protein JNK09_07815 [Prolixibacteraceae bacterium]|nr:hypothetical protein [Prolixibacteraceae bacterium]
MKIKHRNLEQIRKSPQTASEFSAEKGKGGKTMIRAWDNAVGKYHHLKDAKAAQVYLLNSLSNFNNNKKNNEWREVLINKFNRYVDSYEKLKVENIGVNTRLLMDIHHNNYITGEILRVDKTPDNEYLVTLQNRQDEIWGHELRFRLLQIHFSNKYKCPYDSIKVGVYNFQSEEHEYLSFDDAELKQAWNEVVNLSNRINQVHL